MCEKNVSVEANKKKKLHSQLATATTGQLLDRQKTQINSVHGHNIHTFARVVYARIFGRIMAEHSNYLNK
jgi:hypothetical protein